MPQQRSHAAVSVATAGNCCGAAKQLEGKLFLAQEAPALPLTDCSQPDACRCRYSKYADRRDGDEDRRFPYDGQRAAWFAGGERRKSQGRRDDD